MYRTILVPLDGSRFAETALQVAAPLARQSEAELHLFLVHEFAPVVVPLAAVPPPLGDFEGEQRKRARKYLSQTAKRLEESLGAKPKSRVVAGRAGPKICREAARLSADLVVMATHGRGSLRRFWFGSVADYVVRHIDRPALLLPPRGGEAGESGPKLERILVALDLSRESEAILKPVAELAKLTGAELTLYHVAVEAFELDAQGVREAAAHPIGHDRLGLPEREMAVSQLAGGLTQDGLRVTTLVQPGINAAGSIIDLAESEGFDLIAMTTHGASGVRRMLIGSVVDKVLRTSSKPILVVRPAPSGRRSG